MKLERGINPNCSELVIRLNTTDIDEAKQELKKIGIEEVLVKNYYEWNKGEPDQWDDMDNNQIIKTEDLPKEALELMEEANEGDLSKEKYTQIRKKLKEKYSIDEGSDSTMLSFEDSHPDMSNHSSIRLVKGLDLFGDGDDMISIMAHQHCQWQLFPALKKISEHFGEEVHGYDGGSADEYESWLNGSTWEEYNNENFGGEDE